MKNKIAYLLIRLAQWISPEAVFNYKEQLDLRMYGVSVKKISLDKEFYAS